MKQEKTASPHEEVVGASKGKRSAFASELTELLLQQQAPGRFSAEDVFTQFVVLLKLLSLT